MADKKISQLTPATTPLAGTEVLPIVQSGTTDQVSVANLTAGRPVSAQSISTTDGYQFRGAENTGYELLRVIDGTVNPGIFAKALAATKDAHLFASGSSVAGQRLMLGAEAVEDVVRISKDNVTVSYGNLVLGTNGKSIVTNTAGQITQDAFSGFTSGVAKVISPTKSSGFMVFVTGYSLSGSYSAILNYGDTITVVNEQNTTGGTIAFTSVSNQLNVTTTGSAAQILQELWVSVIGK